MKKLQGWVVAVDEASNCAGVSLWRDDLLVAVTTLNSDHKTQKISRRLQTQVEQLTSFLSLHLAAGDTVDTVIFEGVRARLVLITVGAFLCCPYINTALGAKTSFVESRQWKAWAKMHGAHSQPFTEIKGVTALREIPELSKYHWIDQDDIADSVLIYMTWRGRK